MQEGKQFEKDIKDSAKKQNIWIYRLRDGYYNKMNVDPNAYVVQNPADYIIHHEGVLYFVECKTTDKKFMTVGDKAMIKTHQLNDLQSINGCNEHGVFFLQFLRGTDNEITLCIPAVDIQKILDETGKKSISLLDVCQAKAIKIPQAKMRVHNYYNVEETLCQLKKN